MITNDDYGRKVIWTDGNEQQICVENNRSYLDDPTGAQGRHIVIHLDKEDYEHQFTAAEARDLAAALIKAAEEIEKKRSLYKDSVQLQIECEGKAGDVIEKRLTTDRACKPSKTIVIDPDPGSVSVMLHLASTGENAIRAEGYVPASYFQSSPLGSGTALPTLCVDDEYIFSFKFERDARIKICLLGPVCRDPRLTIAERNRT